MENPQEQKLKEIRKAKQEEYGDFTKSMNEIGVMWSILLDLDQPIPGYVVSNMYVAAKLVRTKNRFKKDTYIDAANYLEQAELMHERDEYSENIFNTDGIVKDQVDG